MQDPLYAEAKQIIGDLEVWKYGHMLEKHAQLREAQEEMTPPPTSIEAEKWILQLTPCLSPQCQRPLGSYSVGGRCCDVCGQDELRHSQICQAAWHSLNAAAVWTEDLPTGASLDETFETCQGGKCKRPTVPGETRCCT